jgi:hypothetical protein
MQCRIGNLWGYRGIAQSAPIVYENAQGGSFGSTLSKPSGMDLAHSLPYAGDVFDHHVASKSDGETTCGIAHVEINAT